MNKKKKKLIAAYPATPPRQNRRSIQRGGPSIEIRLLTDLGIERWTLMFHLVKSWQPWSGLPAVWGEKKSLSPDGEPNPRRGVYTSDAKMCAAEQGWLSGGPRDWPLLAVLDRSVVATATGSSGLVFGAAGGVTAEDFVFGAHLGGQLTWRCQLCSTSLFISDSSDPAAP